MANKKILNATEIIVDDIKFKSILESKVYQILKEAKLDVQYEPKKFVLWEGFRPNDKSYFKGKDKIFRLQKNKILDIKYTPDFFFKYNNMNVYVEAKGKPNDVFYIKEKMFRKYIDCLDNTYYFKVQCVSDVKKMLCILQELQNKDK